MSGKYFWVSAIGLLLHPLVIFSQTEAIFLRGRVMDATGDQPLIGATVQWYAGSIGTATDIDGHFQIPINNQSSRLIVSFVGYEADTLTIRDTGFVQVHLQPGTTLEGVNVVHRKKAIEFSLLDPAKVERINEKELLKAACCNLSESFETNPSVDVAFSDAVTGTRQIQMLGLAGPYTQITRENMPYVRGLAAAYGLTFVPGTWVEGMQLTKGAGSVINGFESIAGQINIELRKPEASDKLYLNLYGGQGGRYEGNLNISARVNDRWSTALLLHGRTSQRKMDRNDDGFMDEPNGKQFIALNRWKYTGENGLRFQFGVNGTGIDNFAGQTAFNPGQEDFNREAWGMQLNIQRLEGWLKMGKVYEDLPWRSWAVQLSGSRHNQDSHFGWRSYLAAQNSIYGNLLYQSIIGNTHHQVLMGLSLQHDDYTEEFEEISYDRIETVPGGFFEYTYGGHEKFSLVAGLRADRHNHYGFFMTPRLHLRYAFNDHWVWRASMGRGQRTASILAENNGLMATARTFRILGDDSDKPFGLNPEIAWNAGTNLIYSFHNGSHPGALSFDLYHTLFQNQIIIDLDRSPSEVAFYNLDGKSYATSLQLQLDLELATRLDLRTAYRYYNVQTTFSGVLQEKPLVARNRVFLNLAYETSNEWAFDYTVNWQGKKRIPFTGTNPETYRLPGRSPDFVVMNAQISKKWQGKWEVYAGAENLLNYRQKSPIIASEDPFGPYFDSALVWGPVFGRNIYAGMRYRI